MQMLAMAVRVDRLGRITWGKPQPPVRLNCEDWDQLPCQQEHARLFNGSSGRRQSSLILTSVWYSTSAMRWESASGVHSALLPCSPARASPLLWKKTVPAAKPNALRSACICSANGCQRLKVPRSAEGGDLCMTSRMVPAVRSQEGRLKTAGITSDDTEANKVSSYGAEYDSTRTWPDVEGNPVLRQRVEAAAERRPDLEHEQRAVGARHVLAVHVRP